MSTSLEQGTGAIDPAQVAARESARIVSAAIQAAIERERLGIVDLEIEVVDRRVILSGTSSSYCVWQRADEIARSALNRLGLGYEISNPS